LDAVEGVVSTTAGYTGGSVENPTYEQVSAGGTGHAEAVEVTYDPARVSYEQLLEVFWHNVDPTRADGQFCDRGRQYRSAIFWHDEEQRRLAEAAKRRLEETKPFAGAVVTGIEPAGRFWPAEEHHQDTRARTPSATGSTVPAAGATAASASCGASTPATERPGQSGTKTSATPFMQ